jgi:tetratricopeptide (TPR) repeat protein
MDFYKALEIVRGPPSTDERFFDACTFVALSPEASEEIKVDALISRSAAYGMGRRNALALADLDDAIRRDPNYGRPYLSRGDIYSALRNDSAALSDYTRATELDPDNPATHYGLAQTLRRLGKPDKAMAALDRARAIDGQNPDYEQLWIELRDEPPAPPPSRRWRWR